MYDASSMTGAELLRHIRRLGKRNGVRVVFEAHRGKGSHGRLWYGDKWTTLKNRTKEIGPGLLRAICRQLGIDEADL